MSGDSLLVEISPPLLEALGRPGDSGSLDFFSLLGLPREGLSAEAVDRAVMDVSRVVRPWQNSPQHGEEAVRLLPLFHRIAAILKNPARRTAYAQELDRALRGEKEDPLTAFRDMVRAAIADGAIDRTSKAELVRFAQANGISMDDAGRLIRELASTVGERAAESAEEAAELKFAEEGSEAAFRESLTALASQGRLGPSALQQALDACERFSIDRPTAARLIGEVQVAQFRRLIERVALGGVISNNQARLLMPKARAMGMNDHQAYAVLSDFMFTGASETDVATMHLTTSSFDDSEIESLLSRHKTVLAGRTGLGLAGLAGALRWVAIGAVALGAIYAAFIIFDRFGSSSSDRRPGAEVAVAPTPARTPAPTELGPELLPDPVDTGLLKVEPERPGDPPAFEVFIHEITCSMYRDFLQGTLLGQHNPDGWSVGFNPPDGWEELPVTGIGWEDAVAYCRWFGQVKGLPPNTARLPTRAEVERMLRYPLSRRLGGSIADPGALERLGQRFDRLTVVGSERRDMLFHPEGQIYGLIGNAAEWGWERNDRGERVVFGAGFEGDGEAPDPLRPKHRPSDARHPIIGFRVVIGSRPLPPQ